MTGHGSLLVPDEYRATLYARLQLLRGEFGGRLHYAEIRKRERQATVANDWVEAFFDSFIEQVSFKATFALHDGPLPLPYPRDERYQQHMVNSTSSNMVGHVRWVLPKFDELSILPIFDRTGNAREQMYYERAVDTARYRINERHRKGKKGYAHTDIAPVAFQSSDHRQAQDMDTAVNAELLQLTDLLLGATSDALELRPATGKAGRRRLALRITDQMALRTGHRPYQFNRFIRHFSVSLYPDVYGRMYSAIPERPYAEPAEQLSLVGFGADASP